jgi:hypothetical protein
MTLSRTELGIGSGLSLFHRLFHFTFDGKLLVTLHSVDYVFDIDYRVPVLDMWRFHFPSHVRFSLYVNAPNRRRVPLRYERIRLIFTRCNRARGGDY